MSKHVDIYEYLQILQKNVVLHTPNGFEIGPLTLTGEKDADPATGEMHHIAEVCGFKFSTVMIYDLTVGGRNLRMWRSFTDAIKQYEVIITLVDPMPLVTQYNPFYGMKWQVKS